MIEFQMLGEALSRLLEHGVVIKRHTCPKIAGGVLATLLLDVLPVRWGVESGVTDDGVGHWDRHLEEVVVGVVIVDEKAREKSCWCLMILMGIIVNVSMDVCVYAVACRKEKGEDLVIY